MQGDSQYHLLHDVADKYQPPPKPFQTYQPCTSRSVTGSSSYKVDGEQKDMNSEVIPLTGSSPTTDPRNEEYKKLSRTCRCDYAAITLCLLIWSLLVCSVGSFVYYSKAKADAEGWIDESAVANAFAWAMGFAALAATLNEALIDRCWRRIRSQALRGAMSGAHLRAANFQLVAILQRIVTGRVSSRELATFFSYAFLRWGTLSAFSIVQLTVQYRRNPNNPLQFLTQLQWAWVPIPLVAHVASVIIALAICQLSPLALLMNKFDEKVVHAAYRRYLDLVPFGSAATSEQVADLLEKSSMQPKDFSSLAVDHKPGLQLGKKLLGILTGALIVIFIPTAVFAFQKLADKEGFSVNRFCYSLGLSTTATGYTFAQNYAIWTLGLEGITASPRSDTNYLGTSSGIMLLVKAFRQRRPIRVFFMYWMFWWHSLGFRFMVFTYTWVLSVHKIVPEFLASTYAAYNRMQIIFWPCLVWVAVLLPFVPWLLISFKAPLAPFDGWRHANILDGATRGKGRYGIEGQPGHGKAAWGLGTRTFVKERLL